MHSFLKKLEGTLKNYIKERYLPPHRKREKEWTIHDLNFFITGADALSTAFTEERSHLPKDYFNKKEYRSAYLLYFTLINAAKVWKCLEQLSHFLKPGGPLKILDLGCGPLTAALTCSDFFKDRPLLITAVDQNKNILKDGLELWKKTGPPKNHSLILQSLILYERNIRFFLKGKKFDIIIAANFLSELNFRWRLPICETLLSNTKNLILIEPALQKTTRDLMQLRDALLTKQWCQVLAPCLHQQRCPMFATNKRDWCHFYIEWETPYLIYQVSQKIGNKLDYLKMAYMIFQSEWKASRTTESVLSHDFLSSRVVSSPLLSKGKKELILCGENGRLQKVMRTDKEETKTNQDFTQAKRGDIVEVPEHKTTLHEKDHFKILKPF